MADLPVSVIGLVDVIDASGSDRQKATLSLSWCSRVIQYGTKKNIHNEPDAVTTLNHLQEVLSAFPDETWLIMIRSDEWLSDDARELPLGLKKAESHVPFVRFPFYHFIGHRVIRHPAFYPDTHCRMVRLSRASISLDDRGRLQIGDNKKTDTDTLISHMHIHHAMACDLRDFVQSRLPEIVLKDEKVAGPTAEFLSSIYDQLASAMRAESDREFQYALGIILAWSQIVSGIVKSGDLPSEQEFLKAFMLPPGYSPGEAKNIQESDSYTAEKARADSLQRGLDHITARLKQSDDRVKQLENDLANANAYIKLVKSSRSWKLLQRGKSIAAGLKKIIRPS